MCGFNQIANLDVSNNSKLMVLKIGSAINGWSCSDVDTLANKISSLDISNCPKLLILDCSSNPISSLDFSTNTSLQSIYLCNMILLEQVCVWDGYDIDVSYLGTTGSPNANFTTECIDYIAPRLVAMDALYPQDHIEATSSEDGIIYLVNRDTERDLGVIQSVSIDSVVAVSNTPVQVPISGLDYGIYWLYARDSTGNISEPWVFTIIGVGVEYNTDYGIKIYPNPTSDLLTIEIDNPDWKLVDLTSLNGQIIYSTKLEGNSYQLDLSSFRKGAYFITIRSRDFVTTRKIFKL